MTKRKFDEYDWSAVDANSLQFLIGTEPLDQFFTDTWEQRAEVYKADPPREKLFPSLSSMAFLKELAGSEDALQFGLDINAARYANGIRETPNEEVGDLERVTRLFEEGCTLQLHQPQRWNDSLWRLLAAMEFQLGCLVGANAYLTPAGTQGLAPHYDDVDLWVCQTEGSKRWRIYESPEGYKLPAVSSKDFDQSEIGNPILEVTLEVGDVLYMPRGTVHQAVAQKEASCHVTISSYQKWTLADFAQNLIQALQGGRPSAGGSKSTPLLPVELRAGLPVNFLAFCRSQPDTQPKNDSGKAFEVAQQAANGLRALADRLEHEPGIASLAADRMATDFLQSRAPPHPATLGERGPQPSLTSQIQTVGASFFRILPCDPSPEVKEAYKESAEFVSVVSCLNNSIKTHMMGGGEDAALLGDFFGNAEDAANSNGEHNTTDKIVEEEEIDLGSQDDSDEEDDSDLEGSEETGGALVFPASFSPALTQILLTDQPVAVKDIRLKDKEERLGLAFSLYTERFVRTVTPGSKPQKQKKAKQ